MNKELPADKKSPAASGKRGKLLGRVAMYSLLLIAVVLVLMERGAKVAAEKTAEAWRRAQVETQDSGHDLPQSALAQHVHGKPTTTSAEADGHPTAKTVETYTWNGLFREYKVQVYLGLAQDPSVEDVIGPNQPE